MTIRKVLIGLCAVSALSFMPAPAHAAAAGTLGYVDTARVFQEYKAAQSSQSEFKKKAEAYQKELVEKNKTLQDMQKQGKSAAEIERMTKKFEAELKPKKAKVEAMDKELSARLKKQIEGVIAKVAAAHQLSTVVDKQVVLYGGQDLTDEVIRRLNK